MKKYKNYIGVLALGAVLFWCGFLAGKIVGREVSLDKLEYVAQYAFLLEEENAMLHEHCRK